MLTGLLNPHSLDHSYLYVSLSVTVHDNSITCGRISMEFSRGSLDVGDPIHSPDRGSEKKHGFSSQLSRFKSYHACDMEWMDRIAMKMK